MAHNIPPKKKSPPDVWGMNKKKSPYGITQSDGIIDETFGPEGPSTAYSNNSQYPPIQQPIQGTNAMATFSGSLQEWRDKQRGGTERQDPSNQYTQGTNPSQDWWKRAFNLNPSYEENDSYTDQTLGAKFDPFQDFEWGMNMPTFQVGKGILDTGTGMFNVWNNFRNYGLRREQAEHAMDLGDKKFAAEKRIQGIKEDDINFARLERNQFKKLYGGPEGQYLMQDPIARS